MSIIDRIRALFGGNRSGAESTAVIGGTVAATSADEPGHDADTHSDSSSFGGSESTGGGDSGGGGGGGGGDGGGG